VGRTTNLFGVNFEICYRLWQKQNEVANDKTAEISLNAIQVENFQFSFFGIYH